MTMKPNELSRRILGAAIEVHREIGPGHDESAYERALSRELNLRGLPHELQRALPVTYKGVRLDCGYRLDVIVADSVLVELKSVECLLPIHQAQVLTYLRLGGWHLGLLLNFNEALLRDGIKRLVLGFDDDANIARERNSAQQSKTQKQDIGKPSRSFWSGDASADKLTEAVIGAAIEVHRYMGPGLLRTTYEACLCHELALRKIDFERKKPLALRYKEYHIGQTSEVEFVIGGMLALKILSVEKPKPVHEAQLISQLKLGRWPFGLLFNFNVPNLPDGIHRLINPKFDQP